MVQLKGALPYILLALFVVSMTAGTILIVYSGTSSPGVEIILPTATPTPELKVHVSGAVESPGVYALRPGDRLLEALDAAGGPTDRALLSCVNLALRVTDEAHYHIPGEGESCQPPSLGATQAEGLIDLNVATAQELETLPGIGQVRAQAIIAYMELNGGFQVTEQLLEASRIGAVIYEGIQDLVYVGGASP